MSIEAFLAKAKEQRVEAIKEPYDVSTEEFQQALNTLEDKETTKYSISYEQFRELKKVIMEYRKEIELGNFIPSQDKLHNIVMWFRVSREQAFVLIKEKVAKTKASSTGPKSRKKKETPQIDFLM